MTDTVVAPKPTPVPPAQIVANVQAKILANLGAMIDSYTQTAKSLSEKNPSAADVFTKAAANLTDKVNAIKGTSVPVTPPAPNV